MRPAAILVLVALAAGLPSCAGDDDGATPVERSDRPAEPPPGYRTVGNRRAGFTVSVPRAWTARTKRDATLIRSRDQLLAATVGADRSAFGRQTAPERYARRVLEGLPEFEGSLSPRVGRVRGSPYRTALIEGGGALRGGPRSHRITVVAFARPGRVTYGVVVFRNPRFASAGDERALSVMLRSFRARAPQASGRSG